MKCYYHHNREATVTCNRCGKGLCSECGSFFRPPVCVDCAEQEAADTKSAMIKSIGLSVILMIVGIIVIRSPLGFLLAGIPSGWRFLNKITPAMFIWMPLVGWLIYFSVKLVLSYFIGLIALPIELVRDIRTLKEAKKLEEHVHRVSK